MLNTRLKAILRELMAAKSYITGEDLAKIIDVTSRTVRNDMKELEEVVSRHGGTIKSVRGTGYQLHIGDDQLFRQFLQEFVQKGSSQNSAIPDLPEERVQYLITRLLLSDRYLKLDDLADELYISKSTTQNDLRDVRKIFGLYGITMEKRPNYGIKLKGDEVKLRYCMSEYIFNRNETHPDILNFGVSVLSKDEMDTIRAIIVAQIKRHDICLSDIGLNNLVNHIAISFKRIQNGNFVTLGSKELQDLMKEKEYGVASIIVSKIAEQLGVIFPEEEIAYISIHLLGTRMKANLQQTGSDVLDIEPDMHQLTLKILESIENKLLLGIQNDQDLIVALGFHLKPAINRFKYNMNLRNPMLSEIKSNYPIAFEAGIIAGVVIKQEEDIEINEHEMGYLALHIGAAIERRKMSNMPKKCLIVCASGMGSASLLSYKLQSYFGSRIEIVGTTEYYNLVDLPMQSLDFIISTIPIARSMPVPVIVVNTFLGNHDFQEINQVLNINKGRTLEYTNENLVFLQRKFETREEVLQFFGDALLRQGYVGESFLASVYDREALSPTSFGNLVAIPHPAVPQTETTFWAVCTLQKPIKWGDKRVQLIWQTFHCWTSMATQ
ncbi:BglG family transcription antiterminator [Bacillus sp. CECT 9360]|uniref:BglG family transcription antiterminator n=1 Tax=Bacillus sp. CECT 9360 TaxID=2845821 RepID=UPI001E6427B3|nr:BglG family transcription antiterminator [Bacillus sp. CECT 9360]CAH0343906.1 putative licABCH operon regulator [Bacillus sp. CECT 9360]